jgi:hypothetical protein
MQTMQASFPSLDWTKPDVTAIIRASVAICRELAKATGTTLDDQVVEWIGLLVAQRYGLPVPAMAVEPVFVVTAHLDELPADVKARVATSPILAALLAKVGPLLLKLLLSQLL